MSCSLPLPVIDLQTIIRVEARCQTRACRDLVFEGFATAEAAWCELEAELFARLLEHIQGGWFEGPTRVAMEARVRHRVQLDLGHLFDLRPDRRARSAFNGAMLTFDGFLPIDTADADAESRVGVDLDREALVDHVVHHAETLLTAPQTLIFLALHHPWSVEARHMKAACACPRGGAGFAIGDVDQLLGRLHRVPIDVLSDDDWLRELACMLRAGLPSRFVGEEEQALAAEAVGRADRRARHRLRTAIDADDRATLLA